MTAILNRLNPEMQALLKLSEEKGYNIPYHDLPVHEARKLSVQRAKELSGEFDFQGTIENIHIPSKNVEGGIPALVYHPTITKKDPPILLYFHGGGMVVGSAVTGNITCQMLAQQCACIIVNVEYRLAPEHKFPCMMDDSVEAVEWTTGNTHQLGGTAKSLVGVFGDSAGAMIAASVSHDVPGIDFQILVYPRTVHNKSFPSYKAFGKDLGLTDALINWFVSKAYENEKEAFDGRMNVCYRKTFDHLPPALFLLAECDPVRDDNYVYAAKLISEGVPADIVTLQGTIHGFFTLPDFGFVESPLKGACRKSCEEAYIALERFVNRMYFHE